MKTLLGYHGGLTATKEYHAGLLPLGLGYLAAVLRRAGHPVTLVNFTGLSLPKAQELIAGEKPGLVGLSVFTHNRHESFRLAGIAKRVCPSAAVVAGGPHANHLPEQILRHYPDVDAVALGEGERTVLEIVAAVRERRPLDGIASLVARRGDGIVAGGPRAAIADLDELPPPDFGPPAVGVDERAQRMYLLSSRGCPADCAFCDSPAFWGRKLRFHSPRRVVAELTDLRDRLGLLYASFRDDTFAIHRTRALELLAVLRDADLGMMWDCQTRVNGVDPDRLRLMSEAGCHHVQYGIESGSPRVREVLAKDVRQETVREACQATRQAGLVLSMYLISGVPGEGEAEMKETERLVEEVLPHDGIVSPLAIFPGTPMHLARRAAGQFDDALFLTDRRAAFLAREDAQAIDAFARYEAVLRRTGPKARYRAADWRRMRAEQGAHAPLLCRTLEAELEGGDVAGAVRTAAEARSLHPEHPWVMLLAARACHAAGDAAAAASHLDALRRRVPRSDEPDRLAATFATSPLRRDHGTKPERSPAPLARRARRSRQATLL